jgi:hypothetical protein
VTAAFDREREGDYLEDGSTLGGLYIASHEADPEVARESAARPLPQPSRADAPTTNRPSSDDGQ